MYRICRRPHVLPPHRCAPARSVLGDIIKSDSTVKPV